MKKLNPVIQFIIGFFSIMLLWGIGALVNTYTVDMWLSENIDTENLLFSCIVPMITVILIPVILLVLAKRKSLKVMYISALIATIVPVVSRILLMIFSDDGNILTWIFGFTIGLVLYPFGRMAFELFDGVSSFFFVYLGSSWVDDSTIIVFLVIAIILSLILYKKKRTKIY